MNAWLLHEPVVFLILETCRKSSRISAKIIPVCKIREENCKSLDCISNLANSAALIRILRKGLLATV